MKDIIINVTEFEIRVALLENKKMTEFFIEKEDIERMAGNIYLGKVANVLPGMESAFVDIGLSKNSFLYVKDLREFEEKYLDGIQRSDKAIEDILNVGDKVVVQILKEPTGTKGARVTTHYTIPGKYLVLMPNNDYIAISKKIKDEEERERLTRILEDIKPKGVGVIIRTAAQFKEESDFVREIEYLTKQWKEIESKISKAGVGEVIYKDNNLIERVVRDILASDVDNVIIDSEEKYWEFIDYISAFAQNEMKVKVKLYQENTPIFDYYSINQELESALKRKIWLSCGGYLIIEKTEALISIDVNTGKNTGSLNLEATVAETNMEAAAEIPRQLRLRNLGGIIIIDFIDMCVEEDKEKVIKILEENLKKDRIRNNIVNFTELGLIEMTRKRVGKELSSYFMETCTYCKGFGSIKSAETVIQEIMTELRFIGEDKEVSKLKLKLNDEVFQKLTLSYDVFIKAFLKSKNKKIDIFPEKNFHREKYEILLEE